MEKNHSKDHLRQDEEKPKQNLNEDSAIFKTSRICHFGAFKSEIDTETSEGNSMTSENKFEEYSTTGNIRNEITEIIGQKQDFENSKENAFSVGSITEKNLDGLMNSDGDVLDQLVAQKDAQIKRKGGKHKKKLRKQSVSENWDFDIGTRVEAKDFNELWHPALIMEIDQEENEFLIHYDDIQKQDEWISKDSPRLRTYIPPGSKMKPRLLKETGPKEKVTYKCGEICLAKWKYRRFPATVKTVLEDGKYEIVFYDGFTRVCAASSLAKMKPTAKETAPPEPEATAATSTANTPGANSPSVEYYYPKHLFDPKTDYLISKKERRDMKRKLNVKELFNIDQGKKKNENLIKVKVQKPKKKIHTKVKQEWEESDNITVSDFWKPEENNEEMDEPSIKEETSVAEGLKEEIKQELIESPLESLPDKIKESHEEIEKVQIKDDLERSSEVTEEQVQKIIEEIKKKVRADKAEIKKSKKSKSVQPHHAENTVDPNNQQEVQLLENGLRVGEWCCRWHNDQPVGLLTELSVVSEGEDLITKKSVQVEDYRLPPAWSKHMVRRTHGSSAGKWDVVLIEPDGKRFRTKGEMSSYLSQLKDPSLTPFEYALMDFGVHRKVSKQLGWDTNDGSADQSTISSQLNIPDASASAAVSTVTPVNVRKTHLKQKKYSKLNKKERKISSKHLESNATEAKHTKASSNTVSSIEENLKVSSEPVQDPGDPFPHVYVGSMKVMVIENLLRCPATGCYKNFRKDNLLRMHIKHYHKEMRKRLGTTPKVAELASLRATTEPEDAPRLKIESEFIKPKKVKVKAKENEVTPTLNTSVTKAEPLVQKEVPCVSPIIKQLLEEPSQPPTVGDTKSKTTAQRVMDAIEKYKSFKAKQDINKKVKEKKLKKNRKKMQYALKQKILKTKHLKPKLIKIRSRKPSMNKNAVPSPIQRLSLDDEETKSIPEEILQQHIDFEDAIDTHKITASGCRVTKKRRCQMSMSDTKKRKMMSTTSDLDLWEQSDNDLSPNPAPNLPQQSTAPPPDTYVTETGEKIKIVKMKREEIINCHCGFREEDGLMIQCELCLCWQHGMCHNIELESQVPDKYVCSICLNPPRGRRSQRWLNEQSPLYDGTLPGGPPSPSLRRLHELVGNLLSASSALHATRCQLQVAQKKDHPKLYLWAKDWEKDPSQHNEHVDNMFSDQLQLNSNYMDMSKLDFNSIMDIDKENLPLKPDLSGGGVLDSPGEGLELPIPTSEIERLAKSVQGTEVSAPEPEAAIEAGACRARLLTHVQRAQAAIDARLDYIEAQVAELESQEQAFEDDETPEFYPKTKQTIQMLLRDLNTLEELSLFRQ